jgi:hypothetical protein
VLVAAAAGQRPEQLRARNDPARPAGQRPQQAHPRRRHAAQLAVDKHRVPTQLHPVPRDRKPAGPRRQLRLQPSDHRPEPRPLRLHRGHVGGLQRARGHRADAQREHRSPQRGEQPSAQPARGGPGQQARGRRRAGERDRVDGAAQGRVRKPVQRRQVDRRHPAVHRNLDDIGAGHDERLDDVGQRLAVQLYRDPQPLDPAGQQVGEHLGRRLRRRRPCVDQARSPDRAPRLRAAGEKPPGAEGGQQVLAEPPAVRGLDPTPETDPRGGDGDVRRARDEVERRRAKVGVVGQRHDPQRGPVHDRRPPALQHRAQLVGAPGRGDADGEPGQRRDRRCFDPGKRRHRSPTCTQSSTTRTG